MGDSTPSLEGYSVFTHNRKSIHRRAKCGSGGVCLFVKQSVMLNYNVSILDKSVEDILWVKFEHKLSLQCINVCVCYLSPDGSSHIVDPHEYVDKLLSQIYLYQSQGQYIICGDFNARCGNEPDYIGGVDEIIERTIVDYKKNHYGDLLIDFLINSNCVMVNGRCASNIDYTSISVKGAAVVDYTIVSHDYLHNCRNFRVKRAHELFNQTDLVGRCDPDHNISDHSVLTWQYNVDDLSSGNVHVGESDAQVTVIRKYDVSQVPANFLCDSVMEMDTTVILANINQSYVDFSRIVKYEREANLTFKSVTLNDNKHAQGRSRAKPWWSDKLTELWDLRCEVEFRIGLLDNGRQLFLHCQRNVDREVRAAKRQYWYQQQQELLEVKESFEFWKTIGRVGISQTQTHKIPWEVLNKDGSVSVDHCVVLERWMAAFEQLLNNEPATDTTTKQMVEVYPVINDTTTLNAAITEDEVRFALISASKGKSLGEDGIPVEVLLNNSCLSYLVNLFNACFEAGHIPDIWSRGIICPILKDFTKDHRDLLNYRGITVTSATYKPFCSILNNRLTRAIESNGGIADEQNEFRAGRSTSDRIGGLSLILESRLKMRTHLQYLLIFRKHMIELTEHCCGINCQF